MTTSKGLALVTGAAKRIGRTIALTLAKGGWDLVIHYNTSAAEAETLAAEIRAMGRTVLLRKANLESAAEVESIVADLPAPLTAVVNNASLFVHDDEDPSGARHHAVNVAAATRLAELMESRLPEGTIGAVVHMFDNTPLPQILSSYAASRNALAAAFPAQALRMAPRVRVNAVAPGAVMRHPRQSEEHFARMVASTPLRHPSSTEDIAKAIHFLLECDAVTGQRIDVDAGMHLVQKKQEGSLF